LSGSERYGISRALSVNKTEKEATMPVFEYVLIALLGAAGTATPAETPGGSSMRTLTADIVTQPNGGTEGFLAQATGGSPGKQTGTGRKGRSHRRHRRHRHTKVTATGKKASKS
jgi:hypothetical protein